MSELPGPEHDPDPAALDELQRAFADEDENDDEDSAIDQSPAVDPADAPAPSDRSDSPDPAAEHLTTTELPEVAGTEPDPDPGPGPGPVTDVDVVPETDTGPETDSAAPGDDASAPTPEAPPRIIRIDDYSGTTEAVTDHSPETEPEAASEPAAVDPLIAATGSSAQVEPPATTEPAAGTGDPGESVEVISISDDDLPDAVYVEGSLDADGSGDIVLIEDDDTGDALGAESQRDLRRGIEPRMRERRLAVKRAQNKRRLVKLAIVAGAVLLVVAVLAVLGSPLFAVRADDVEVFGAVYTDEDRLAEVIDDAVGTPVLRLDTGALEDDLEAIPWVETATARTDFPHGLIVDIRERAAVTTYRGPDGAYRVLDRDGRVLDVLDKYPFAYVLLGGPDPVDLDEGDFAPQGYVAASELATNLTNSMRGQVERIEVTADGSRMLAHMADGSTVFFGEASDLLAKLVRLEAVLTNGQECEPGLIDISTADVTRCQ